MIIRTRKFLPAIASVPIDGDQTPCLVFPRGGVSADDPDPIYEYEVVPVDADAYAWEAQDVVPAPG